MCPQGFLYTVTALASAIAENHTDEEIALLSALFTQLGDTLSTIAAKNAICTAKRQVKEE